MKIAFNMFVFFHLFVFSIFVDAQNSSSEFESVRQRLIEYREAYKKTDVSNENLLTGFFSIELREGLGHVDLEDRFPSYVHVRLMKLPTEVLVLDNISVISCKIEQVSDMRLCINFKGLNAAGVHRNISIQYKFENDDWFIDSLAF